MSNVVESVKKNPWKAALSVFFAIPTLITIIYFASDVRKVIVTQADLQTAKNEIINELRDESAKIRVNYVNDLESRLEDVEIEMETLIANDQFIPEATRRKAKRLQRRIEEMTNGS